MRPARGMGDILPSKMPMARRKPRRDDTDFTEYAKGGKVWDKPNPSKKHKKLGDAGKAKARALAKAAGRPYPNLIDNMRVARGK